jgi:Restriction endonuclease
VSWSYSGPPAERIGEEKGEYFERTLEDIFKFAGFQTQRDKIFPLTVRHEIDVWAEAEFGAIAVECKDWRYMSIADLKKELDAFATKVRLIGALSGVFALNAQDEERFQKYRNYAKSEHLSFWDAKDVEYWRARFDRHKDKASFQKELCDGLGVVIRPLTQTEKAFGFLKKATGFSLKAAQVTGDLTVKALESFDEKPRRRKKHRRSRR